MYINNVIKKKYGTYELIKQYGEPIKGKRLFNIKVLYTAKTSLGKKFINYLGPVSINSLPIDVKKITKLPNWSKFCS